jgi:hypothetical protein
LRSRDEGRTKVKKEGWRYVELGEILFECTNSRGNLRVGEKCSERSDKRRVVSFLMLMERSMVYEACGTQLPRENLAQSLEYLVAGD